MSKRTSYKAKQEILQMNTNTKAPHGWIVTVKANGDSFRTLFDPKTGLEQLQASVCGYIELVALSGDLSRYDGFCNDEGRVNGMSVNEIISVLYGRDKVFGDVVICKHDASGDTQGLTNEECKDVIATLKAAGATWKGDR